MSIIIIVFCKYFYLSNIYHINIVICIYYYIIYWCVIYTLNVHVTILNVTLFVFPAALQIPLILTSMIFTISFTVFAFFVKRTKSFKLIKTWQCKLFVHISSVLALPMSIVLNICSVIICIDAVNKQDEVDLSCSKAHVIVIIIAHVHD